MNTYDIIVDNFQWFARTVRQNPEKAQTLRDEWMCAGRYEVLVLSFNQTPCGPVPYERLVKC